MRFMKLRVGPFVAEVIKDSIKYQIQEEARKMIKKK